MKILVIYISLFFLIGEEIYFKEFPSLPRPLERSLQLKSSIWMVLDVILVRSIRTYRACYLSKKKKKDILENNMLFNYQKFI